MQRELAELVRVELSNPQLGMVTIQAVEVVRDFSHAKVFFTFLGGELDQAGVTKTLKEAAPMLRHELAQRMRMRTIPALHFVHDESVARGVHLSALIDQAVDADAAHHHESDTAHHEESDD
jgi:ribosome-binding factor A